MNSFVACRVRKQPLERIEIALATSRDRFPEAVRPYSAGRGLRGTRLAVNKGRRWPPGGVRLTVSFVDGATLTLRRRILEHMNAWSTRANVEFVESRTDPEVRISRYDSPPDFAGYWSYLGTEILGTPADEPTMNLEGFTGRTAESEFRRVVRHEAGHTLGFDHEHMRRQVVARIDPRKALRYFRESEGWTAAQVREQVLTPLDQRSITGTRRIDVESIMCYQLPGEITVDGLPIVGGDDISEADYEFAARIYPKR